MWLSLQFQGASLEEPVANGRPWDLDRNQGGLRLLMPEQGTGSEEEDGFAQGNADHVYRFDYLDPVETHRRNDAECAIVTSEVPIEEADDHDSQVGERLGAGARLEPGTTWT